MRWMPKTKPMPFASYEVERLLPIGERDDEGMVAVRPAVGEVGTLLALAEHRDHQAPVRGLRLLLVLSSPGSERGPGPVLQPSKDSIRTTSRHVLRSTLAHSTPSPECHSGLLPSNIPAWVELRAEHVDR